MSFYLVLCACVLTASASAYNFNRDWSYYRPETFAVDVAPNVLAQPSQNLFWDKLGLSNTFQGSNQVGGGWWGSIQNKFPFLTGLFSSRMELPTAYSPYNPVPVYGPPPQVFYPVRQYYPARGVQVTDDAVVVSAPGVPPFAPSPPAASPPVSSGYDYSKPQYRLELPGRSTLK